MPLILNVLKEKEYASYYKTYLSGLEYSNIVSLMIRDFESQLKVIESIPEDKLIFRYKKEKWSISELLLHVIDSESVFTYRALSTARNDKTNLPGFEHNDWVIESEANKLTKELIIGLYKTTRNHSISLFKSFTPKQLLNLGNANNSSFSVRALAYVIIGHNQHHFKILKEYYLD
jgi:hypothetical protein